MASKLTRPGIIKNVVSRGYGAQAAAQQSYLLAAQDVKVTKLPSGAVVASRETFTPVAKVAVLFKAGSRYEGAANKGASHVLRASAGLATHNKSAFGITRALQQVGGSLAAESGREHVLYGVTINRNNLAEGLEVLGDVATQPAFKQWELDDNLGRVKTDLALRDPAAVAVELLHQAAYRAHGLGNSIFVPGHMLAKHSHAVMSDFVAGTHLAGRMAVVGLGVDHDALVAYAGGLSVGAGAGAGAAGGYGGAEIRQENGAAVTCVAVAGAGASLGTGDAAALAVAQQILGTGPTTKYGSNASSVLARAVAASGGLGAASAINVNYSDSGLFGYFVMADAASAGQVVAAVHAAVSGLQVSEDDVARGKVMAKAAAAMALESTAEAVEEMGLQALLAGGYDASAAAAIDAVTPAAVQGALAKVLGGKLSMGAVGSLSTVPYLDQL